MFTVAQQEYGRRADHDWQLFFPSKAGRIFVTVDFNRVEKLQIKESILQKIMSKTI
jgi:hypothetical protein